MKPDDLKARTFEAAVRTIRLVRALPGDRVADTLGRQLVKSSTSVAANYRAACRAQSTKDFVSKMKKVEEESDESVLWFALLRAGGVCTGTNQALDALGDEYDQLTRIAVQSIKTARLRLLRESIRYPVSRSRRTRRDDS